MFANPRSRNGQEHVLRLFGWLLVVLIFAATPGAFGKTKLVWFSRQHAGYIDAHGAIATAYMALHPEIEVEMIPGTDQKLMSMLASGLQVDVYMANNITRYLNSNLMLDLTPYVRQDPRALSRVPPALLSIATVQGRLRAVPTYWFSHLGIYNATMWNDAGLTPPSENWNWDEFRALMRKFKRDSDGDGQVDVYGLGNGTSRGILYWFWGSGGEFLDETFSKPMVASPASMRGWEFIERLEREQLSMPLAKDARTPLAQGKVAFLLGTIHSVPVAGQSSYDYELALPPIGPAGPLSMVLPTFQVINANSLHPREAFGFTAYLTTAEAQQIGRAAGAGQPVATTPTVSPELMASDFRPRSTYPRNMHYWVRVMDSDYRVRDVENIAPGVMTGEVHWNPLRAAMAGDIPLAQAVENMTTALQAMIDAVRAQ